MKVIFVCPQCEETVIAEYDKEKLDIIEGCSCIEEDMEQWFEYIYRNWDKIEDSIVKYDKLKVELEKEVEE